MGPSPHRLTGARLALVAGALLLGSVDANAQAPPDSARAAPEAADSVAVQPDTISADTIFYNLPTVRDRLPSGFATGVWSWDRRAIMASGAQTLAELVEEVPGLVTLLGGDYGTPAAMTAWGRGGAAYRIVRDGFEVYPVDGGVSDLQQIGLVGIGRVRLRRAPGQMVVEMWSHLHDDGRPFSVIEAGTGDLDTNMFRGVYADPTALMGSVAVGLERVDTRGIGVQRTEGGNRTGSWVRYQLHRGDDAGIAFDWRRGSSETQVDQFAPRAKRSDLSLRASWRPAPGVVVVGLAGRSTLERDPTASEEWSQVGGSRNQLGGRVGLERGRFWLDAGYRAFGGDLPSSRLEGEGGVADPRWGGATARAGRSKLEGTSALDLGGRVWVTPTSWATLFGEYERGDFGAPSGPIADGPPPPVPQTDPATPPSAVVTEREGLRVGGLLSRWNVTLAGAALYSQDDRVVPLGIELDMGAPTAVGVHRNGFEAIGVFPMPLEGLRLEGSFQWWDEEGPYLPRRIYRGSFEFHRVYLETGNLELWASLGVRGHDPMLTFAPEAGEGGAGIVVVPFFQSWYAHMQVRVVTVRLWLGMENMTFRRNLQTHPGRRLPYARSFFALRWDMWN